jgi:uncharacterized cupin superfamily protein
MAEDSTRGDALTAWLVDEQVWQPDDETDGQVAMLVDIPGVQGGLWRPGRSDLGPVVVDLEGTEVILVLTGTGTLEVNGGPPLQLAPGVAARIEAGSHTLWNVSDDFTELWLYV